MLKFFTELVLHTWPPISPSMLLQHMLDEQAPFPLPIPSVMA